MREKRISIPVLVVIVVLTAICTAAVSQWYFVNQKGSGYNTQLVAKVVSIDGNQLTIKGDVTNRKGQNGTYIVNYHSGLTLYDPAGDEITLSDLQPEDRISVYYNWNIPKYVSPHTKFEELFSLEENQRIPDVMAIAQLGEDEHGKDIRFFEPGLGNP